MERTETLINGARATAGSWRGRALAAPLLLVVLALAAGCRPAFRSHSEPGGPKSGGGPLTVAVSTGALGYCSEAIGGDQVRVLSLLEGDAVVPSRPALQAAQQADLILLNGAGWEPWLNAVTLPAVSLVEVSLPSAPPEGSSSADDPAIDTHRHGPIGASHRQGPPVLNWLDLKQLSGQCVRVHRELAARRPGQAEALARRHQDLQQRLKALDDGFLSAAGRLGDVAMVAAGPGYRPLARRYGLSMRFTRHGPGSDPSGGDQLFLQELDDLARQAPLEVVVLPAGPSTELEQLLARRGLEVLVVDPLSQPDRRSTVPQGLQRNLDALQAMAKRP